MSTAMTAATRRPTDAVLRKDTASCGAFPVQFKAVEGR